MKKIILTIAFLFIAGSSVFAQNLKIGFIDSRQVMTQVAEFRQAQENLNREIAQEEQKIANMQREVEQLFSQLEQQALILSEQTRKEREEELRQKYMELNKYMQEVYGPRGRLEQKRSQLAEPILKRIREVIGELAREERFDMILDSGVGVVLYGNPSFDLTQRVINELNAKR